MSERPRLSDLQAYLEEALPAEDMARIERAVRSDAELAKELAQINSRRDAGLHSVGDIWRRHRLSCPSREELGSYLLGVLPDNASDYMKFHLETIGCRYCRANLDDLQQAQSEAHEEIEIRRRKYYQSSAGYLRRK
jgi:hypothetical protein